MRIYLSIGMARIISYYVVILHQTAIRAHVYYYSITVKIGSRIHNLSDNYVKITDSFRETKQKILYTNRFIDEMYD